MAAALWWSSPGDVPWFCPSIAAGNGSPLCSEAPNDTMGFRSHRAPSKGTVADTSVQGKPQWKENQQHRVPLFAACYPAGGTSAVGATKQILIQLLFLLMCPLPSLGPLLCLQALQVTVEMNSLKFGLSAGTDPAPSHTSGPPNHGTASLAPAWGHLARG